MVCTSFLPLQPSNAAGARVHPALSRAEECTVARRETTSRTVGRSGPTWRQGGAKCRCRCEASSDRHGRKDQACARGPTALRSLLGLSGPGGGPWLPGDAAFAYFLAGSSLVRAPPACCAWSKGVRRAQARTGRRRSGHGARTPMAPLRRSVCLPVISHPASTVLVGVPRQFRAAILPQLPTLATPYIRAADAWQMPDASLLVCIQTALLRSSRAPSEHVGASDVRSRRPWTLISLRPSAAWLASGDQFSLF
jgi:hypothetical protein